MHGQYIIFVPIKLFAFIILSSICLLNNVLGMHNQPYIMLLPNEILCSLLYQTRDIQLYETLVTNQCHSFLKTCKHFYKKRPDLTPQLNLMIFGQQNKNLFGHQWPRMELAYICQDDTYIKPNKALIQALQTHNISKVISAFEAGADPYCSWIMEGYSLLRNRSEFINHPKITFERHSHYLYYADYIILYNNMGYKILVPAKCANNQAGAMIQQTHCNTISDFIHQTSFDGGFSFLLRILLLKYGYKHRIPIQAGYLNILEELIDFVQRQSTDSDTRIRNIYWNLKELPFTFIYQLIESVFADHKIFSRRILKRKCCNCLTPLEFLSLKITEPSTFQTKIMTILQRRTQHHKHT